MLATLPSRAAFPPSFPPPSRTHRSRARRRAARSTREPARAAPAAAKFAGEWCKIRTTPPPRPARKRRPCGCAPCTPRAPRQSRTRLRATSQQRWCRHRSPRPMAAARLWRRRTRARLCPAPPAQNNSPTVSPCHTCTHTQQYIAPPPLLLSLQGIQVIQLEAHARPATAFCIHSRADDVGHRARAPPRGARGRKHPDRRGRRGHRI